MAAGVPVVATDIPGTRELVVPGETGFLVAVGTGRALPAGPINCWTTPRWRVGWARRRASVRAASSASRRWCRVTSSCTGKCWRGLGTRGASERGLPGSSASGTARRSRWRRVRGFPLRQPAALLPGGNIRGAAGEARRRIGPWTASRCAATRWAATSSPRHGRRLTRHRRLLPRGKAGRRRESLGPLRLSRPPAPILPALVHSCTLVNLSNWLPLSPPTARSWSAARDGSPPAACNNTGRNRNAGWIAGSAASARSPTRPPRRLRRRPRPVAPHPRRPGRNPHRRNAHPRLGDRALRLRPAAGHARSRTDRAERHDRTPGSAASRVDACWSAGRASTRKRPSD